jgi:formate C-acetyltransferase
MGFGRVDQFLYPTYKKDIESGHIDQEYATQLLECFRVKMMAKRQFLPDVMTPQLTSEGHFHNCVLGGVDPKTGKDATNELSYLWLEAATRVRTPHPTLSVRWHALIDQKFMNRALEVVALGLGFPAFFGDDASIPFLLERGYTLEEARDYAIAGCVLHVVPGKTGVTWPVIINYGKMIELTINNGFDRRMNEQLSIKTGDFTKMKSFDEFVDAYKAQCVHWSHIGANSGRQCRIQHIESFPEIMMSAIIDDCIVRGKPATYGGAAHNDCNMYMMPVGVQDVGNELYVLKHGIFSDHPICSKEELQDALTKDWEGYEQLRAKVQDMPKYGNDMSEVDELVVFAYRMIVDIWYAIPAAFGYHYEVAPHSIGFHGGAGAKCGALPCGRKAWVSMSDGAVSPAQGTDTEGPAAVINSAGRVDQSKLFGVLFNMRFTPATTGNATGRANLAALIKTYFHDYKGKHIQFNVVSREEMIAAKKEPEKHKDLIVRVAGYSAYWTDLTATLHDELIARSENVI